MRKLAVLVLAAVGGALLVRKLRSGDSPDLWAEATRVLDLR